MKVPHRQACLGGVLVAAAMASCTSPGKGVAGSARRAEERVLALADAYVAAYFEREPLEATEASWPAAAHGRLPDNSAAALAVWHARQDSWLAELAALPRPAPGTAAALARAIMIERLEADRALRVCRFHLWFISPNRGWQAQLGNMAALQPIGTPRARVDAVARLKALPRFLGAELENLRTGVRLGYVAPRSNVERMVGDLDALLAEAPATSSLALPAVRDPDPAFRAALVAALEREVLPAVRAYRDFLSGEYRRAARTSIGVSDTPGGEACYRAAIRSFATVDLSAEVIHATGLRHLAAVEQEMRVIAARSFADEMGLYSSDLERLGMLSWEALRAARLVVDSGIHVMGWSEQQAIDFLSARTSMSPRQASAQVGRYIGTPGQASSYLIGMLEIRRLRDEAQRVLGDRFDLRAFHDRVLERGSVPLPVLREEIGRWLDARQ